MCVTDLDLPEITEDEQVASPDPHPLDGRYAGVAWGLAERHDGHVAVQAPAEASPAEASPAEVGSR